MDSDIFLYGVAIRSYPPTAEHKLGWPYVGATLSGGTADDQMILSLLCVFAYAPIFCTCQACSVHFTDA